MSAVIGGIITIWLAAHGTDGLVSDDYYKEGLAVRQVLERDQMAKELGLHARLKITNGNINVGLDGGLTILPDTLQLRIIHPTRAGQDLNLTLRLGTDQRYTVSLPDLPSGKRLLQLEAPDRSWRLTGEWHSPFTGERSLQANP